jgi:urease accessory protein
LSLEFGRDRFSIGRQDPPWKVVRAFPLAGGGKLVHLNNVSGGVLAGDRLALEVTVAPDAAAQITTTGATRLYRHRHGEADSEQHATFHLGEGAQLEYLPDPVIPYAASRHHQRTEFQLGRGATLFWWEVSAPGRFASGERFAFERLRVQSSIAAVGRPILREDYLLEPSRKDVASPIRMLGYSHMASFYAVQEGRPAAFWRALEERLTEIACAHTSPGSTVWGASALVSDGILVRGLAASGRSIHATLVEFWRAARIAITGIDATPPRKIY